MTMRRNNGGLPRALRSELIYAAAAANAWVRGLPLSCVALQYRYEPITALNLLARLCRQYGVKNIRPYVPVVVLARALQSNKTSG